MEKVTKALFLFDDIPMCKLCNEHIKNLFHSIGHSLSSETTYRKTVLQLSANEFHGIRNAVQTNKFFWLKSLILLQYLNIVVKSLEISRVSYLYNCQPLSCAPKTKCIAQAVDNAVGFVGINRQSISLL